MKSLALLTTFWVLSASTHAASYTARRDIEAPFAFTLHGVDVNKGSTLQRESILLNDASCPIQLAANAMHFAYSNGLRISSVTDVSAAKPVVAVEVRHLLYDVFGRHMQTLTNLDASDIAAGSSSLVGSWDLLDDNTPSEFLTTVTFVSHIRFADGTLWSFNLDSVVAQLGTLRLEKKIEDDKKPEPRN